MIYIEAPCVACLHTSLTYFGQRDKYTYYKCCLCGTLQLHPLPSNSTLAAAYKTEYAEVGHCQNTPDKRNRAAFPQFDAISTVLKKHSQPTLTLDCGAGWGGLLNRLRELGIPAEGAELSAEMVDYCAAQGHTIHRCTLDAIQGESRYDAILLSSVFEHLVSHEQWLCEAKRLLKKNGLLISLQPTAPFATLLGNIARCGIKRLQLPQLHQVFWPPWHTVLFSLPGMVSLLEKNGFDLVEIRPAPLQKEGGVTGILQFAVSLTNKIAVPIVGVGWPLCVGHIFVFRARR